MNQTQGWLLLIGFGLTLYLLATQTFRRQGKTSPLNFYVAGRTIGWKRASLAIASTWIWAPALFVAAQQGYQNGWVGVFWFTVPNVACLLIFGSFAQRARRAFPDGFTISGAAKTLYSTRVQRVYLIALMTLATCAFAVQLLAGGIVVSSLTGIPYLAVTIAMAAIALSYSLRKGIGASIHVGAIQMGLLAGIGIALSLAVAFTAGPDVLAAGLTSINGDVTSLTSGPGAAIFWSFGLGTTIGLLSGPFGDQSFWQITWSIREDQVKRAYTVAGFIFAIVPLSMSLLGFAAAGAGLEVSNLQLTNLESVLNWLPAWVAIPFLIYVFAGLVSTLDSHLCSVSSLAGNDIATRLGRAGEALKFSRLAMLILATVGVLIANIPGIAIVQLFVFYGTVRACTLIPTMLMIRWPHLASEKGAFIGILAALIIGIPMSAVGNLNGIVPLIVAGSLSVLLLSGGITIGHAVISGQAKQRREDALQPANPTA